MHYRLIYSKNFQKIFKKLDSSVQRLLTKWIKTNLENTTNPRQHGKALTGNKKGFWRYRIANYRLIVEIRYEDVIILIINFGHRKEIYTE